MSDIAIPTYVDLMLPTLQALDSLGGSANLSEIDELVVSLAHLSDEQLGVEFPEEGRQKGSKVLHRLAWARTYLKKAGAIDNSQRGIWTLLPEGRRYLGRPPGEATEALRKADNEARRKYREQRKNHPGDGLGEEPDDLGEADWQAELLAELKQMPPDAFERLTQRLLREAGFRNVEVMGRVGDGGLDGVGVYRLSLVSFPTYFQCKRYSGSVGSREVRDFRGAMSGRGEKGLLATTGTFTPSARDEATRDGAPPVDLVDGVELCGLLKRYEIGVKTVKVTTEHVEIDDTYFRDV